MSAIRLKTPIPGPRSKALQERRERAVPRGVSHATPIFVAKAEGAILEDVDGNRFIDLAGGIGCANAGHRAPAVIEAIERQAAQYLHTCFMVTPYEPYIRLVEKLNALAPGLSPKKTALFNSGAEAVENGIKIARAYTRRPAVLCFEHAFHGRTLMALSLTSKPHPYKAGFEPFASDVYRLPYANAHALEEAFKTVVAAESVAAVIVEPVLGEGGFIVPPVEFFAALEQICRKHGILLIADEVQTGFARTGRMFACEHFGLDPDLLLTAKTLGGGLPLSAVTGKAEIMDRAEPGGIGGTFGGNPLACEAGLATLETIERLDLCARAHELGKRFHQRFGHVANVHGLGAMQAIKLAGSAEARQIAEHCLQRGVIVLTAGTDGDVIRLLMPLVISDEEFDEALEVLHTGVVALEERALSVR